MEHKRVLPGTKRVIPRNVLICNTDLPKIYHNALPVGSVFELTSYLYEL